MAYFSNRKFWYELFQAGRREDLPGWLCEAISSEVAFESVMGTLTDYCFLEVQASTASWSMHTCVHDWALATLNQTIDKIHYWYAVKCVGALTDEKDFGSLADVGSIDLAAHAHRLEQICRGHGNLTEDVTSESLLDMVLIARLLQAQVQLVPAEEMYVQALEGLEKTLGLRHGETLSTVEWLGLLYRDQGKLKEAEEMLSRALRGLEETVGAAHASTLGLLSHFSIVYRGQGKLKEAEEMWLRALRGYEVALGPEHVSTLGAAMNLGLVYRGQGKLKEAEEMSLRALRGFEEALGPEHRSTLHAALNLGSFYRDQGKLKEAEEMWLRALRGYEEALGPEHTSTLNAAMNLGSVYSDQGKMEEAEKMYVQSLRGSENVWGPEHTATLKIVKYLATVYRNRARTYHVLEMKNRLRISSQLAAGRDISRKQILPLIIHLCSRYSPSGVYLLGIAGRVLLWTGDRENSQLAFQNQITMTGDGWSHGQTLCDSCEERLTMKTGRFVCMACSDVDLCEACHRQYDVLDVVEEATTGCTGHQFFAILQRDPNPTKSSNDERLSAWMERMLQRYPVVSEVERS
jgi:tetratricopeptide (TPR) repeat protein